MAQRRFLSCGLSFFSSPVTFRLFFRLIGWLGFHQHLCGLVLGVALYMVLFGVKSFYCCLPFLPVPALFKARASPLLCRRSSVSAQTGGGESMIKQRLSRGPLLEGNLCFAKQWFLLADSGSRMLIADLVFVGWL